MTTSKIERISILGLGAIGSNLLLQLSKVFPDMQFEGLDFDKVEARNIGPQAYFLEHVGQPKAKAMQAILTRFNRKPKYSPLVHKLTTQLPATKPHELVVDCFDNAEARKLTLSAGNVLHVGFSPLFAAEAIWSPGYVVPGAPPSNAPDICTVPAATAFIHFVVNAAAMAVAEFVLNGNKKDFIVSGSVSQSNLRYL